jgi:GxxExxY protein
VDLLIERLVVVEIKACEKLTTIHLAQLLTYLKLTDHKVGLLINFNVELLRHGTRRVLNG